MDPRSLHTAADTEINHDKALSLVLSGKSFVQDEARRIQEQIIVERYFLAITSFDVESAISEFEYAPDAVDRKEAAQVLVAYFNWCCHFDKDFTSDRRPIQTYVIKFSQLIFSRIAGDRGENDNPANDYLIPTWVDPNVAYGWSRPASRPRENTFERDVAIAAFVERLIRNGCERTEAKKRAAQKFGRQLPTIEKALSWDEGPKSAFGERFSKLSADELDGIVLDYFEAFHQRHAKKRDL